MASASRDERTAIVTLTRGGAETGLRLHRLMPDSILYAPAKFVGEIDVASVDTVRPFVTSIRQTLQSAFEQHGSLVCVMASGIVVRELAPLLRSKHSDPGVVVVDEGGRFAVSLLGGHKGGANRLAQQVASCLGGQAVLTTSSDVQGLPAVDLLGRELCWTIENEESLTPLSAALANGESVGVYQDAGWRQWLPAPLPENIVLYDRLSALCDARPSAAIVVSVHVDLGNVQSAIPSTVVYRPKTLCVGVGCNRGTSSAEIHRAVADTLADANLSRSCIHSISTIEDKSDEEGLIDACREYDWPLTIYTRSQIAAVENVPNPSEWAHKALGVWGVAEPAALLAAGVDWLLVEKKKHGNVTVAVALREEGKV